MGLTTEGGQAEMNNNLGLHVRVQYEYYCKYSYEYSNGCTVRAYEGTKEREWYVHIINIR